MDCVDYVFSVYRFERLSFVQTRVVFVLPLSYLTSADKDESHMPPSDTSEGGGSSAETIKKDKKINKVFTICTGLSKSLAMTIWILFFNNFDSLNTLF